MPTSEINAEDYLKWSSIKSKNGSTTSSELLREFGPLIEVDISFDDLDATDSATSKCHSERILAKFDTGAGQSTIRSAIAEQYKLKPVRFVDVRTGSGNDGRRPVYKMSISLVLGSNYDFTFTNVDVIGLKISDKEVFELLIGRDVLSCCTFSYDGVGGRYAITTPDDDTQGDNTAPGEEA